MALRVSISTTTTSGTTTLTPRLVPTTRLATLVPMARMEALRPRLKCITLPFVGKWLTFQLVSNSDPTTGTTFFEQVLTVDFIKLTLEDANKLRVLAYGRPQIIVEDNQGNLIMLGAKNGMDVTGGTIDTGQAFGDKNGMQITFTGRETVAFMELVGPTTACTSEQTCAPAPFGAYQTSEIDVDPSEE